MEDKTNLTPSPRPLCGNIVAAPTRPTSPTLARRIIASARSALSGLFSRKGLYLSCRADGSVIFPSRKLFELIRSDHPGCSQYFILFSRAHCMAQNGSFNYIFFVNPFWKKHGVPDPRRLMTQQLVLQDGHIGLHAYQPTVHEIFATYGIPGSEARIAVSRAMLNGEPYYILERP